MNTQIVIIESVAFFVAMMMNLALKPKLVMKVTGYLVVASAAIGFVLYGYGFSRLCDNLFLAGLRTTFAICRMFLGYNEISEMSQLAFFRQGGVLTVLWLAHITAFYAFASTAISLLGKKVLGRLYRFRTRFYNLTVVYGINDESVSFALYMAKEHRDGIVAVDEQTTAEWTDELREAGCLVYAGGDAARATKSFLKLHGVRAGASRKVTLYALHVDEAKNIRFIRAFSESLEGIGVKPSRTRLVLWSADESVGEHFQASGRNYGFGTVNIFHRRDVAARLMIRHYPPAAFMRFDGTRRAAEDFEALIIGFGQTGQEALRKLIMNAQFEGSRSRILVCADEADRMSGNFFFRNRALLDEYDVQFIRVDARSREMYEWLLEHRPSLNYVVVATGNERMNSRLELELSAYLDEIGSRAVVVQCASSGVRRFNREACRYEVWNTFAPEILHDTQLDRMAMVVNDVYDPEDTRTKEEKWYALDYFSRLSCRAYADFIPQLLLSAGLSTDDIRKPGFTFEQDVLENLSRTEHLRWCAFHFCMGYQRMTDTEYKQRIEMYRKRAEDGSGNIQIAKNAEGRTHACLIGWEALAELSKKETLLTGMQADYQEKDRDNIRVIPRILGSV